MRKIIFGVFIMCSLSNELNAQVNVGGDSDKHGCKGSAGYTWSELKKECIQPFTLDIKLSSVDTSRSYSTFAALIFSKDRKMVEVIMEQPSVILKRTGKKGNYTWKKDEWTLRQKNGYGYEIKKGNKLMYKL